MRCWPLAISLLAVTALTQKRWLFIARDEPDGIGVIMGLAGLLVGIYIPTR